MRDIALIMCLYRLLSKPHGAELPWTCLTLFKDGHCPRFFINIVNFNPVEINT